MKIIDGLKVNDFVIILVVFVVVFVVIVVFFVLYCMCMGCIVYVIGGFESLVLLMGLLVYWMKVFVYVISGVFVGFVVVFYIVWFGIV